MDQNERNPQQRQREKTKSEQERRINPGKRGQQGGEGGGFEPKDTYRHPGQGSQGGQQGGAGGGFKK
jgi:hypothetical protein